MTGTQHKSEQNHRSRCIFRHDQYLTCNADAGQSDVRCMVLLSQRDQCLVNNAVVTQSN